MCNFPDNRTSLITVNECRKWLDYVEFIALVLSVTFELSLLEHFGTEPDSLYPRTICSDDLLTEHQMRPDFSSERCYLIKTDIS